MATDLMISRTYRAKPGSHYSDQDAAIIGPELTRITEAQGGSYVPEDVVTAAKASRSALHAYFEWDNTVAGAAYRVIQAKELTRAIVVEFTKRTPSGEEVQQSRGWVSLTMPDASADQPTHRRYVPIETAAKTPCLAAQLVDRAKAELGAFQARYKQYADLPEFFALRPVLDAIANLNT